MKTINALRSQTVQILGGLNWLPPLLGRITIGAVFIESGWGKLHNIAKVTQFFTELGIPGPMYQAYLVSNTELWCGLAVLLGLLTRLASIPLIVVMLVAIWTAKTADLHGLTDIFAISEFLYIVILIWLVVDGAGRVSLDALLCSAKKSPARTREV